MQDEEARSIPMKCTQRKGGEMTAKTMGSSGEFQLKATDIPKSRLNNRLNGIMNLQRWRENGEHTSNHCETEDTHRQGSGARIRRPVTTSTRSETDVCAAATSSILSETPFVTVVAGS